MDGRRVLVLGRGQQGRVIASALANEADVATLDVAPGAVDGTESLTQDVTDAAALTQTMKRFDLVVGALPSRFAFAAARCALAARTHLVDVAFFKEDLRSLHREAKDAGCTLIADCGLAPGLSNIFAGRMLARYSPRRLEIQVGGVAEDPSVPFGYVITWCLADLLEEYTRPARILRNGVLTECPALSEREAVHIPEVGDMEAFLSDGLRSLLTRSGPLEMVEKTLRWAGHLEAIQPLLDRGQLLSTLEANCLAGPDLVVLRVLADDHEIRMSARPKDGLSAMARTTALTTAACARWCLACPDAPAGAFYPEDLADRDDFYHHILDHIAAQGFHITPDRPLC